jgi:hypothetical protein
MLLILLLSALSISAGASIAADIKDATCEQIGPSSYRINFHASPIQDRSKYSPVHGPTASIQPGWLQPFAQHLRLSQYRDEPAAFTFI